MHTHKHTRSLCMGWHAIFQRKTLCALLFVISGSEVEQSTNKGHYQTDRIQILKLMIQKKCNGNFFVFISGQNVSFLSFILNDHCFFSSAQFPIQNHLEQRQ